MGAIIVSIDSNEWKLHAQDLIALMPLLLAACVDDSASYYADGPVGNHALTIHRAQKHFWSSARAGSS
jgi:hypothetical protein